MRRPSCQQQPHPRTEKVPMSGIEMPVLLFGATIGAALVMRKRGHRFLFGVMVFFVILATALLGLSVMAELKKSGMI